MKIVTSDLRMDASTGYREVHEQAGLIRAKQGISGAEESVFHLPLPPLAVAEAGFEKHAGQSCTEAISTVRRAGESTEYTLAGQKTWVSETGEAGLKFGNANKQPTGAWRNGFPAMAAAQDGLSISAENNPLELFFSRQSIDYSFEKVSLASSGHVTTADGREIDFSLDLSLEREDLSMQGLVGISAAGMLIDPLVLSFDDGFDVLADTAFSFDLDGDGCAENIAGLRRGSGFLGIDLNGDSKFNDGGELFGPRTGFAFNELQAYDEDGNNWLDENDPVFARLGLWMGAGSGDERLVSLQEAGVGALALASTENQFSLKNSAGRFVGRIDRSGLFLMADGAVRSLQEIDLEAIAATEETVEPHKAIETISQALVFLQRLISIRRHQLEHLTMARFTEQNQSAKEKGLTEKFWEWQEENQRGSRSV